ncbi:hypothetical protein CTEN210_17433 [Chaetoceros tenuissimus]|uniref:Uncharacterized protein n=1 Tax=Chaetoceros tenuissimus TaxID=426638 RepID=A0AAD3DAI8_9STRA|nr:hypothetical protein CTEN210_17433 [Chaetoceros tenuissimus]
MSSPPPGKNAFALLMTSARKKKRKAATSSNFVQCAICNKSFPYSRIQFHQEECILQQEAPPSPSLPKQKKQKTASNFVQCTLCKRSFSVLRIDAHITECTKKQSCNDFDNDEEDTRNTTSVKKTRRDDDDDGSHCNENILQDHNSDCEKDSRKETCKSDTSKQNAFSKLLEGSKKAYTTPKPLRERFHLYEDDGVINLKWFHEESDVNNSTDVAWSEKLIVKTPKSVDSVGAQEIELIVSSSIPSDLEFSRVMYVRKHSKFSVPVLKSILQKSVRRRRPKPSVRVAMEIADKALGELIRRLPIICLEDSFLHHEFPFLVWLMIAHSKDFIPPKYLLDKVMQIVYEISSCPWQDVFSNSGELEQAFTLSNVKNLSFEESDKDSCQLMIRAMVLRKAYGGMRCDMKMMDSFMQIWSGRFTQRLVDETVIDLLRKRFPHLSDDLLWKDVPLLMHSLHSPVDINQLTKDGFEKLLRNDISASGIDFHCSNIVEALLQNDRFHSSVSQIIKGNTNDLADLVKSMMWNYSSGVNHRIKMQKNMNEVNDGLKSFWKDLAVPLLKEYTDRYIDHRLS